MRHDWRIRRSFSVRGTQGSPPSHNFDAERITNSCDGQHWWSEEETLSCFQGLQVLDGNIEQSLLDWDALYLFIYFFKYLLLQIYKCEYSHLWIDNTFARFTLLINIQGALVPINKQAWPGTRQFTRVQCDGGGQEAGQEREEPWRRRRRRMWHDLQWDH